MLPILINAQIATGGFRITQQNDDGFQCRLFFDEDSLGNTYATLTSDKFSLNKYDGVNFTNYKPVAYYYIDGTPTGGATDTVTAVIYLLGYFGERSTPIDTIVALAANTTSAATAAKVNLNFNGWRANEYAIRINQRTTGSPITTGEVYLKFIKKENDE
jgi:hypothetical protein